MSYPKVVAHLNDDPIGSKNPVRCIKAHPRKQNQIIAATLDSKIRIWCIATLTIQYTFKVRFDLKNIFLDDNLIFVAFLRE